MPCILRVLIGEAVLFAIVATLCCFRAGGGRCGPKGEAE